MLKYQGYVGHVTFDDEVKIFHGEILGMKDVVTFQGENAQELEQAFKESVDDYLAFCKQLGKAPNKPYSGVGAFPSNSGAVADVFNF